MGFLNLLIGLRHIRDWHSSLTRHVMLTYMLLWVKLLHYGIR